jgi:hypothetical protein
MIDNPSTLPVAADGLGRVSTVASLAAIPEEKIWLFEAEERPHQARPSARRNALHAHPVGVALEVERIWSVFIQKTQGLQCFLGT